MNRIDRRFAELRRRKEKAFIAFVTAGDPDYRTSLEVARTLIKAGVDVLELGLPFSDPIADGPQIQKSSQRSLKAGMNTDRFFAFAKEIRGEHKTPLVCMTYYNLLLHRGLGRFAADCRKNGIDGLIIPDLPVEESAPLLRECRKTGIRLIFLVAPTTTGDRLKRILKASKGFVYAVSLRGITGVRKNLSEDVKPLIRRVRRVNKTIPLAVGFGISTPKHVRSVVDAGADAAIVGSALVKAVEGNLKNRRRMLSRMEKLASEMKKETATE